MTANKNVDEKIRNELLKKSEKVFERLRNATTIEEQMKCEALIQALHDVYKQHL